MTLCSNTEIRRCRPLLGTFVEIRAAGLAPGDLARAVDAAYAAIKRVQRLMSVHDGDSELSRVNRDAVAQAVRVSRETFAVLERGLALAAESNGAFDFTVASTLTRWGLRDQSLARPAGGGWRDVELLRGNRVRFQRPVALDLGGIAKGHAVDAAIETLRSARVESATVNAGGDLRVFGPGMIDVHLRHPAVPQLCAHRLQLSEAALATSSPCFTERRWRGRRVSHLVNPRARSAIIGSVSVSVTARECWLADALTKIVFNAPDIASSLLSKYGAEAFVLAA